MYMYLKMNLKVNLMFPVNSKMFFFSIIDGDILLWY